MTISAPARTWAITLAESLAAFASEMWMTFFATAGIMPLPNVRTSLAAKQSAAKMRRIEHWFQEN